jgi:hypothetical protein
MALNVVEPRCDFTPGMERGNVVVESDVEGPYFQNAFDELNDPSARTLAQQYAAQRGCAPAWLNGNIVGPYPVNREGLPLDEVKGPNGQALPQTHPRMQPHRYQITVPVCQPIR